jgi:hypothetical protein
LILPLWEGAGSTIRDVSGGRRDFTPPSAAATPAWTIGAHGPALAFDETDDRLDSSLFSYSENQATVTPAMTIALRFQLRSTAGTLFQYLFSQGVLGNANTINIYYREDGATSSNETTCQFRLNGAAGATQILTGVSVTDTLSHSLVLTLDSGDNIRMYFDGVLVASSLATDGAGYDPTDPIRIGANRLSGGGTSADRFFAGLMSFVGVFRSAWTADQIRLWHAYPMALLHRQDIAINSRIVSGQSLIMPEQLGIEQLQEVF